MPANEGIEKLWRVLGNMEYLLRIVRNNYSLIYDHIAVH
jgi:hypothetical protein